MFSASSVTLAPCRNDEELNKLLAGVTIAQGGVLPNIQAVLLPKKSASSKEKAWACTACLINTSTWWVCPVVALGWYQSVCLTWVFFSWTSRLSDSLWGKWIKFEHFYTWNVEKHLTNFCNHPCLLQLLSFDANQRGSRICALKLLLPQVDSDYTRNFCVKIWGDALVGIPFFITNTNIPHLSFARILTCNAWLWRMGCDDIDIFSSSCKV